MRISVVIAFKCKLSSMQVARADIESNIKFQRRSKQWNSRWASLCLAPEKSSCVSAYCSRDFRGRMILAVGAENRDIDSGLQENEHIAWKKSNKRRELRLQLSILNLRLRAA